MSKNLIFFAKNDQKWQKLAVFGQNLELKKREFFSKIRLEHFFQSRQDATLSKVSKKSDARISRYRVTDERTDERASVNPQASTAKAERPKSASIWLQVSSKIASPPLAIWAENFSPFTKKGGHYVHTATNLPVQFVHGSKGPHPHVPSRLRISSSSWYSKSQIRSDQSFRFRSKKELRDIKKKVREGKNNLNNFTTKDSS